MEQIVLVRTLAGGDVMAMRAMLAMFGEAFGEPTTYTAQQPNDAYLKRLLSGDNFVAVAAFAGENVIGGIAGYLLPKFEQPRMELYVYDVAVATAYRRRGVATAMFQELKSVAAARGVYVIFVQADYGDEAAIALYTKLESARMCFTSTSRSRAVPPNLPVNRARRFMPSFCRTAARRAGYLQR